jgi:hypothetical protein
MLIIMNRGTTTDCRVVQSLRCLRCCWLLLAGLLLLHARSQRDVDCRDAHIYTAAAGRRAAGARSSGAAGRQAATEPC